MRCLMKVKVCVLCLLSISSITIGIPYTEASIRNNWTSTYRIWYKLRNVDEDVQKNGLWH